MTRREALLTLLCAVCLAVLPGCSGLDRRRHQPPQARNRPLGGRGETDRRGAHPRAAGQGRAPAGPDGRRRAGGTASFSDWGNDALPEVGDDVILTWIGDPSEELSFPIKVNSWEPTVSFYESLDEAHEVSLPAPMLRFFSQTADELVADFAGTPELALEARADGEDLVLTFTGCNSRTTARTSSRASTSVTSLLESEDVDDVEVADNHASVTIAASPALLDKPLLVGQALMAVPGCAPPCRRSTAPQTGTSRSPSSTPRRTWRSRASCCRMSP